MADRTAIRAVGIGTVLVLGSSILIGWAVRHQRTSLGPLTAEVASRQLEGGI
jgi:hypothetical protein